MMHIFRFETRHYFELMVKTKVDTINDKVVTTGRTISQQSSCAIYSASAAWIVRLEIDKTSLSQEKPSFVVTLDFLFAISFILISFNKTPMDNLFNVASLTLLVWFEID